MDIIAEPHKFLNKDGLDRIFVYLNGNINQYLIDYLSNNIKNRQIKFIDKIVLFYQKKIKDLSNEQIKEVIDWKKEYIYQSDIFISFFNESESNDKEYVKSYNDLKEYIKYFYETYKESLSDHFLLGYKEPYNNQILLNNEIKKASNNLLSPLDIKEIKELGDLILQKIEKLYIETNYGSNIPNKLKTIWPVNYVDFNIGILGKYNTGKLTICHWFFKGRYIRFFQRYGPGTDRFAYEVEIKNKKYTVEIHFPAGQEKYDAYYFFLKTIIYKNCFIFTFDISDKSSFEEIKNKYYIESKKFDIKIKHFWVLVGNKSDLRYKREVSYKEADSFAKEKNMKYFEVSVKSGDNMEYLFNYIHSNLIETIKN